MSEAKEQVKHGQWLLWLDEHCAITERTAQLYMRIARHKEALESKSASFADLTLEGAARELSASSQSTPELIDDVRYLWLRELGRVAPGVRIGPRSLDLPDDLTFEQWKRVGQLLGAAPFQDA